MNEVLIIGHKNPDADSVCSAFAYTYLKNRLDNLNNYTAARCGQLNKQTKYIFIKFNIKPPVYVNDIFPKVKEIMTREVFYVRENDPFFTVLKSVNDLKIRLIPVTGKKNYLKGIISIPEIANFFSVLDAGSKPQYLIRAENFPKVLPGYFLKGSKDEELYVHFLVGAMPFDRFREKLDIFDPRKVLLVVGKRKDIIEYAADKQVPAIVLTGMDDGDIVDFENYNGCVYVSSEDTAETLRLLTLSTPAKYIMDESPVAKEDDYVDTVKDILRRDYHRGVPVVDDNSKLKGILTRSNLLKRIKKKVILIDHNEFSQAVDGIETAEIVEIIDHHRLGTIKTDMPIYVYAKPVGSSCTLVYQLYKFNNIDIPKDIALLLLSGLLSDTVVLESPTVTQEDIDAAGELGKIANMNIKELGREIFGVTEKLADRNIKDIIESDFKVYTEYGVYFGIGQVEVTNLKEIDTLENALFKGLKSKQRTNDLDWVMLLVTNILNRNSILLSVSNRFFEDKLLFNKIKNNEFYLPEVISRKKQLLPEILRILEDIKDNIS